MKKILFVIPLLALIGTTCFGMSKAIPAYAEGASEESVSQVSEEVSSVEEQSQSETASKFDYNSIVIDGKTIEQWKKELSDENTRNAAIMAIVWTAATAALFLLKWLVEHGLIRKNAKTAELASLSASELKDVLMQNEEKFKAYYKSMEERSALAIQEAKKTQIMLDTIMKSDPTLVASDVYQKTLKALENTDGEKK